MSTETRRFGLDTPIGQIIVTLEGEAVAGLEWGDAPAAAFGDTLAAEVTRQIDAYFDRRLKVFELPLKPASGNFAQAIRQAMIDIPLGRTRTYGEIAKDLGVTAQAVGQGCGANTIPIIVPCHRVLAKCGLGGFSGGRGIETKVALLRLESAASLLI
jgi:methylated-DNA-[protein]-cysteine S-methyltransferase